MRKFSGFQHAFRFRHRSGGARGKLDSVFTQNVLPLRKFLRIGLNLLHLPQEFLLTLHQFRELAVGILRVGHGRNFELLVIPERFRLVRFVSASARKKNFLRAFERLNQLRNRGLLGCGSAVQVLFFQQFDGVPHCGICRFQMIDRIRRHEAAFRIPQQDIQLFRK